MAFAFSLIKKDTASSGRLGRITTSHGEVTTPVFMPVGTQATVKTLSPEDLHEIGAENGAMVERGHALIWIRPAEGQA